MNRSALKRLKAWLKEWNRVTEGDDDEIHSMDGSFITEGKHFELRASDIEALIDAVEKKP